MTDVGHVKLQPVTSQNQEEANKPRFKIFKHFDHSLRLDEC